jgi:hypothetical protein
MIAPTNDFEACFTQIMKRQSPKLDLVAAGYNGRFVRSIRGDLTHEKAEIGFQALNLIEAQDSGSE